MNTHSIPPNHDHDHEEAQWQAQERAFLAARDGTTDVDTGDLRVALALRQAPPVDLPMDFAAQVAGLARTQVANDSQFEQRLLRGLSSVFVVSAVVTVAWFGRSWPAALAAALPGGSEAASWSMAAGVCVVINWAFALLRSQRLAGGHTPG